MRSKDGTPRFEGFVEIRDGDTGEVLLAKKNAIHYENMSHAFAMALAHSGQGYVHKLYFGNGASTVTGTGAVSYFSPNTTAADATLYNPTYTGKIVDGNSNLNPDPIRNFIEVSHVAGQTYTDMIIHCFLDYNEPSSEDAFDDATDNEGMFVFDEIGLVSYPVGGAGEGLLLTHCIFHPLQKSLNRAFDIKYTLRIHSIATGTLAPPFPATEPTPSPIIEPSAPPPPAPPPPPPPPTISPLDGEVEAAIDVSAAIDLTYETASVLIDFQNGVYQINGANVPMADVLLRPDRWWTNISSNQIYFTENRIVAGEGYFADDYTGESGAPTVIPGFSSQLKFHGFLLTPEAFAILVPTGDAYLTAVADVHFDVEGAIPGGPADYNPDRVVFELGVAHLIPFQADTEYFSMYGFNGSAGAAVVGRATGSNVAIASGNADHQSVIVMNAFDTVANAGQISARTDGGSTITQPAQYADWNSDLSYMFVSMMVAGATQPDLSLTSNHSLTVRRIRFSLSRSISYEIVNIKGAVSAPIVVTAKMHDPFLPQPNGVLLDFENGNYSIAGASCTVGQIAEVSGYGWTGEQAFSPSYIVAGEGLAYERTYTSAGYEQIMFKISTAGLAEIFANGATGFTAVMDLSFTEYDNIPVELNASLSYVDGPPDNNGWQAYFTHQSYTRNGSNVIVPNTTTYSGIGDYVNIWENFPFDSGTNRIAMTLAPDRLAVSVNGEAAVITAAPQSFTGTNIVVTIGVRTNDTIGSAHGKTTLKRLSFIPVVADSALPTMSS